MTLITHELHIHFKFYWLDIQLKNAAFNFLSRAFLTTSVTILIFFFGFKASVLFLNLLVHSMVLSTRTG